MAVFGEAIFGHVGEYKARVYSAQYVRSEDGRHHLVNAGGLTEQDTLNKMFGRISIGPQNDSAFVLALNTEMKGYSWAVRAGRQTGSRVSGGYCHAVHSESKLSSMHEIDSFLYFPFIPDGDYCVSLIRNPGSFNAQDRWQRNMQSVSVLRDNYNEELGRPLNIPAELMKRLTAYIISQSSVNSRQYLYIRVPDRAPYEAYCLAALHDILSHIPAGLRAGISAATNCLPQEEQYFGIIFQRATFPARHETDISLHSNEEYPFLSNSFVSPAMKGLLDQFVDYPELTDKCFRTMEQAVFGDELPDSFRSYENYYGISTIQKEKDRPSYLEECCSLLESTSEPVLRSILEKIILDEFRTPGDLEAAISRDPLFSRVGSFADLSGYLRTRDAILSFLSAHNIRYSMMFIYGHLTSIASSAGIKNVVDFYDKIVSEQENLAGLSEAERRQVIYDSHVDAWNYFAQVRDMAEKEGNVKPAVDLFGRLADLDRKVNPDFGPPVNEINWYNRWQRSTLLEQFRTSPSPETAEKILSIPDLDQATGRTTCLTRESADLIDLVRRNMESSINSHVDPETARVRIDEMIGLADIINRFLENWKTAIPENNTVRSDFNSAFERALYARAVDFTSGNDVTGDHLAAAMQLAAGRMPSLGQSCIYEIECSLADRMRRGQIPAGSRPGIYTAAAGYEIAPELQQAYTDWVASEIRQNTLEENQLRELYQRVKNPDIRLQELFTEWSENTSRKKELLEKMSASKTLVKYLNTLLYSRGTLSEQEIADMRGRMWKQLDIQEKTISAFTASVAYLYNRSAEVVYLAEEISSETSVLKKECRILAEQYGMGIYLDPNLAISEFYETIRQYKLWTGLDSVRLYSKKDLRLSGQKMESDPQGGSIYSVMESTELLHGTLRSLLWVLDGQDYSVPGGKKINIESVIKDLQTYKKVPKIMQILEFSGILGNNPNLMTALEKNGYQKNYRPGKKMSPAGADTGKYLLAAGLVALTFALGFIISHFAWPKVVTEPAEQPVAEIPQTTDTGSPAVTDGTDGTDPAGQGTDGTDPAGQGGAAQPAGQETDGTDPAVQGGAAQPAGQGTEGTQPAGQGGDAAQPAGQGTDGTDPAVQGTGKDQKGTQGTGADQKAADKTEDAIKTESAETAKTVLKTPDASENKKEEGKDKDQSSGKEKVAAPKFSYNGDDIELVLASQFAGNVVKEKDNKINVKKNQVFLPGKAIQVDDGVNDPYLAVKYCLWDYTFYGEGTQKAGTSELVIEKPGKSVYVGYVKLQRKEDGSGYEYDFSELWRGGPDQDEINDAEIPETVKGRIGELNTSIKGETGADDIREGVAGYLSDNQDTNLSVIFDGNKLK